MTLDERITQLEQEVQELRLILQSQNAAYEVDPQYARTLGEIISTTSGKTAASGTQAVDEGGSATYNVMKAPDGFIKIGDKNVPYIN